MTPLTTTEIFVVPPPMSTLTTVLASAADRAMEPEPCAARRPSCIGPADTDTNRPDQSATIRAMFSALAFLSASPVMTIAPVSMSRGAKPAALYSSSMSRRIRSVSIRSPSGR